MGYPYSAGPTVRTRGNTASLRPLSAELSQSGPLPLRGCQCTRDAIELLQLIRTLAGNGYCTYSSIKHFESR